MRRIPPILVAILIACVAARYASAQTAPGAEEDVIAVLERVRDAVRSGDRADLLRHLERVDRLTSNHPIIVFQIARTRAALGDTAGALAALRRLAPMGLAVPIATDSAFRILHSHPDFRRIAEDLARSAAPLVRSDTAFVTADPDLLPESVAYDSVERAWYLGSLARHEVVRVAADGSVRPFAAAEGRGRVIGIKVDSPRRRLWMLETTIDSAAPRTYGGVGGWTSLRGYDLATGREIARHAPSDREGPHLLNDLAVSAAGDVYVSDLFGNAVWRLRAGADSLEVLARGPASTGPTASPSPPPDRASTSRTSRESASSIRGPAPSPRSRIPRPPPWPTSTAFTPVEAR